MTAAVGLLVLLVVWAARRRAAFDAHVARVLAIIGPPRPRDELAERRRA